MKLSLVILNYNVRFFLEQCLLSVEEALKAISAEIIVVDNASSDDSSEVIPKKLPQVRYIQNADNLGFSRGNNIGIAVAKGEYICLLNPDTAVSDDVFHHCLQFAESICGIRPTVQQSCTVLGFVPFVIRFRSFSKSVR